MSSLTVAAKTVALHHDDYCYQNAYDRDCLKALDRLYDAVDRIESTLAGTFDNELVAPLRRQLHDPTGDPSLYDTASGAQ